MTSANLLRRPGKVLNQNVQRERRADAARKQGATIYDFPSSIGCSPVQLKAFDREIGNLHGAVAVANHDIYGDPLPAGVAVQRRGGDGEDAAQVHAAAERGVSGGGGRLPYAERIQAAFGAHDVSGIAAHVGGAATEACDDMGASAYATGSSVAFRGAPDLHTAAHEAAHIVQQRAGVSLKGGVGAVGDRYEAHADRVADLVVRGQSAEQVLNEMTGGGRGGGVQRAVKKDASAASKPTKGERDIVVKQLVSRGVFLTQLELQLTRNEWQLEHLVTALREDEKRIDFSATLKGELATFSMRLDSIRGFVQDFPSKAVNAYMQKAAGVAAINELTNAADWRLNLVWGLITAAAAKDLLSGITSLGTAYVGAQVENMRKEGAVVSDQIEYIEAQRTKVGIEIHKTKNAYSILGKQLDILARRDFDALIEKMDIEGPYKAIEHAGQKEKVQRKSSGRGASSSVGARKTVQAARPGARVPRAGAAGKLGDLHESHTKQEAAGVVQRKSADGLRDQRGGAAAKAVQRGPQAKGAKDSTATIAYGALADTIAALPQAANRVTNIWEFMALPTSIGSHVVGRIKAGTVFGAGQLSQARVQQIAETATSVRTGNCLENACTAAVFAAGRGAKNVMILSIPNHLFIAINLAPSANATQPETWGEAYIVDGWKRTAYPAKEYKSHGLNGLSFEAWFKS